MLGIALFYLLLVAFVAANALTDSGVTQRRRMKRDYATNFPEIADFERSGGRVQELDDASRVMRRLMLRPIAGLWLLPLLLILILGSLGLPVWIPAALFGIIVVAVGATDWLISDSFELVDASAPRSRRDKLVALLALTFKGVLVATGVWLAATGVAHVNAGSWSTGVALQILAILLLTYSYVPAARVDRYLQNLKEVEFATTAKTDAFLFLRSFGDDDFRLYTPYGALGPRYRIVPGRKRFEELMASVLIGKSDLVGVGRPGEDLPLLGASRTYWDQDNWKNAIKSTASRVEGILLLAGRTPSLRWEMEQLADLGLLGKTLVLFPPDDADGTAERYTLINDTLIFSPQHRLPDELLDTLTAIAFDGQGTPIHYISFGRDWSAYVATILHFQLVLDGDIQFAAEGSFTEAAAMAEDPFYQASYFLEKGDRARAEAILKDVPAEATDTSFFVGRAWQRVALHQDFAGARRLLLEACSVNHDDPMAKRSLGALDASEHGGDIGDILRARYAERFHSQPDRIRSGTNKLSGLVAGRLQSLVYKAETAEEGRNYGAAHEYLESVLELAESQGVSTLIAFAKTLLGHFELQHGNFGRASHLFGEAATLRNAPRVRVSAILPRLEPVDIVDEALQGLVKVADEQNDIDGRNAALLKLLTFRSAHGAVDDAARAAEDLGRSYADAGDLEAARRFLDQAEAEYTRVGRLSKSGQVMYVRAQVEENFGDHQEALANLRRSIEVSMATDDLSLRYKAHRLAGEILNKTGEKDGDADLLTQAQKHYETAYTATHEALKMFMSTRRARAEEYVESHLKVSTASIDLGCFLDEKDPPKARRYFLEACEIRAMLSREAPDDYRISRELAYSFLYLAINARRLQRDDSPTFWRQTVSRFSILTETAGDMTVAARDFRLCLGKFMGTGLSTDEVASIAAETADIRKALGRIAQDASPGGAYEATRSAFVLSILLEGWKKRTEASALHTDVLAARRRLVDANPDRAVFRRGVAFSLLSASSRHLPENPDAAAHDFRDAISMFEELASSAEEGEARHAQQSLLFGWAHATEHMVGVSHVSTSEFAHGTAQVVRRLVASEPHEPEWNRTLAWALHWHATSLAPDVEALRSYQAILDLNLAKGVPPVLHQFAQMRSRSILSGIKESGSRRCQDVAESGTSEPGELEPAPRDLAYRLSPSPYGGSHPQILARTEEHPGSLLRLFNLSSRGIVSRALADAQDRGQASVIPENLFLALLDRTDGVVYSLFETSNIAVQDLRGELNEALSRTGPPIVNEHLPFANRAKEVLLESIEGALYELGDHQIGVAHLLLGLTSVDGPARDLLENQGVSRQWLLSEMRRVPVAPES